MTAAASSLTAVRERVAAIDGVTWAVFAIAAVALVIRVVGLGDRALHHDESLHAMYSWYFAEGQGYRHDPLMHGPLQFHLIAASFLLFGDSDAVARLPHALMGAGLVLTPLLLRRWLGGTGVVLAALFLALSPSLLYFSRFARNDIPVALFTVLMVIAIWRYRDDGRLRWLVLLAAGMALSFASKETAYLNAAVILLVLNALVAHTLFWSTHDRDTTSRLTQALHALWLMPVAWVIAALWRPLTPLRERLGFLERPREVDLLVVTGTLVLPLLAASVLIPVERAWGPLSEDSERLLGIGTVLVLLAASALVGILWQWQAWVACFAVFVALLVPFYMSLGTNPEGIAGAYWTSLAYWIDQHEVQRGDQPWYYYAMLVPFYELLILLPAVIGGLWLSLRRGDGLAAVLLFWAAGTFVALSIAGEKMPWLTVPIALPLALLAAYALGRVLPAMFDAMREGRGSPWQWAGGGLLAAVGIVLFAHTLHTNIGLNARHPDTPVEPLIYVQTAPEVPELARDVRAQLADGRATHVVLDQTNSLSWPWAWYLRGEVTEYADLAAIRERVVGPGEIWVLASGTLPAADERRTEFGEAAAYRHRWWFPEDTYRDLTAADVVDGLRDGSWPRAWLDFAITRMDEDRIGALHGEILFPAPVEDGPGAGP